MIWPFGLHQWHWEAAGSVTAGVEGAGCVWAPECYPLGNGKWCLIVDQFATGKGYLPFVCRSLEKGDFDMGMTKKRHGGVLKLTDAEYDRIRSFYNRFPDWGRRVTK